MEPINYKDNIEKIFNREDFRCMDRVRIEVNDDGDRERLNLSDYNSICKMSHFIQRVIKGYGYKTDGNYDNMKKSDPILFAEFVQFTNTASKQRPQDRDQDLLRKFKDYIDEGNFWPRAMPSPGDPLRHLEITQFDQWLKRGMQETSDPESKYQGEVVPLWPRNS